MPVSAQVLLNRLLARGRFRHLQVLVKLAELGSVLRTAQAVGMTQPGVTQLLADLEALTGVELFHRHARGVMPTAVCRDLLPMARQCLGSLGSGAEAIAERQGLGRGVVRVWASTAALNGLLVRALPTFSRIHPGVQLQVREREADEQFLGMGRGEVDLAACRETPGVPQGWRFLPLMEDEFVVVGAPSHPLARRKRIRWESLATETWLPSPVGSIAQERFNQLAQRFAAPPRVAQVITRVSALTWAMLSQERLLTLVPRSVFRQLSDAGQLVVLQLDERFGMDSLGVVLPQRDVPPATQLLVDFLQAFVAQPARKRAGQA